VGVEGNPSLGGSCSSIESGDDGLETTFK